MLCQKCSSTETEESTLNILSKRSFIIAAVAFWKHRFNLCDNRVWWKVLPLNRTKKFEYLIKGRSKVKKQPKSWDKNTYVRECVRFFFFKKSVCECTKSRILRFVFFSISVFVSLVPIRVILDFLFSISSRYLWKMFTFFLWRENANNL